MADLTNKNKIGVIKSGSLHARMAEKELLAKIAPDVSEEVDPLTLPNRIAVMIDTSGSMGGEPIKLLEQAVQDFVSKSNPSDTAIAIESFPEQTRVPLTSDKTKIWFLTMGLTAGGGTPMGQAMMYCLNNYKMSRAIIISDGEPDHQPLDEAEYYRGREIKIDTVHIGKSESGEACLKRISELTGGLFVKFRDIKSFATAFSFLLPETRENAAQLFLGSGANEVKG